MIINQYVNRFLNFCEYQGLNRKTIIRHEFNLKGFVKWIGDNPITKESLRDFIVYQKNRKPRTKNGLSSKEGLAVYSINSYIATLKKFVYYLWSEEGYLHEDLSGAIHSLKQKTFMPVLLTPYEIYSIINCPRHWDEFHSWVDRRKYDIFFELLACMGLRKFEALGLKVEDFNFTEGILRITYGKGGKGRIIPIPGSFGTKIQNWFVDRKAKPSDWVFQSRNKTRIGYSTFVDELKKRVKLLGINKRVHMHLFRHCFITELIKAEVAALKVARIVGHSSLNSTMRYTHLVVDDLKDPINKHPLNFPLATEGTENQFSSQKVLN